MIEVNIHPAHNWNELVEHTEFLYQAAFEEPSPKREIRVDGRHTGTGGGNHFVPVAQRSPTRRSCANRSCFKLSHRLVTTIRASYLFSGFLHWRHVAALRIDGPRHATTSSYELEIALSQIEKNRENGSVMPPWLDRTLRNILIDVTGNTHRSEFCIDKLCSPDGPTGRWVH